MAEERHLVTCTSYLWKDQVILLPWVKCPLLTEPLPSGTFDLIAKMGCFAGLSCVRFWTGNFLLIFKWSWKRFTNITCYIQQSENTSETTCKINCLKNSFWVCNGKFHLLTNLAMEFVLMPAFFSRCHGKFHSLMTKMIWCFLKPIFPM